MKTPDPFRQAKVNPLPAMLLYVAFLVFWALFPLAELRDGAIHIRGVGVVTAALQPVQFWLIAVVSGAVGLFALCQIGVAVDALLNRTSR